MSEYGAQRAALLIKMMARALTPNQVAEELEEMPIADVRLKGTVMEEAARYRELGERWDRWLA